MIGEQTVERERRITSKLKAMVFGRRHVNRIRRSKGSIWQSTKRLYFSSPHDTALCLCTKRLATENQFQ